MKKKLPPFDVPSIVCIDCARPIQNILLAVDGVTSVTVNTLFKQVIVEIETDIDDAAADEAIKHLILQEIEEIGQRAIPLSIRDLWLKGSLGIVSGLSLMIFCMLSIEISFLLSVTMALGACALTVYLGMSSYRETWFNLFNNEKSTLTMDSLFAVSSITAMAVSIASLFLPGLPMMFDVGLLIFGFRLVGKAVEEGAKVQVLKRTNFTNSIPRSILRWQIDQYVLVEDIADVVPGDIIQVAAGQFIPLNGNLISGSNWVEHALQTGNTELIDSQGILQAGMKIPEGSSAIEMTVTAKESQSALAERDAALNEARMDQATIVTTANQKLQYFVPFIMILAILSACLVGCFFTSALAIQCAIGVLVSACPCILGSIVPLAITIAISKGAEYGVLFKNGDALEAIGRANVVVFDLNGPLTSGERTLKFYNAGDPRYSDQTLLSIWLTMESGSPHSFARSICQYAQTQNVAELHAVNKLNTDFGVGATIDGKPYRLGNRAMLDLLNIPAWIPEPEQPAHHYLYLLQDSQIVSCVTISDPLRPESKNVIASLQKLGAQVHLCTGSDPQTARTYADELSIPPSRTRSACLPSDKANYIRQLTAQPNALVAFVGDGGNDAEALATASVGISVQSQSAHRISSETAGVNLQQPGLTTLLNAFLIGEQTLENINQNLCISLIYNMTSLTVASGLLLSIGVSINPGLSVALMILQTCIVMLNAYRFQLQALPEVGSATYSNSFSFFKRTPLNSPQAHVLPALDDGDEFSAPLVHARDPFTSPSYLPSPSLTYADNAFV